MSLALGAYIRTKRALDIELVPSRVSSKDNWSDPISRGLSRMWRKGCCETGGRGNSVFTPFGHDVEVVNPLAPKGSTSFPLEHTNKHGDSIRYRPQLPIRLRDCKKGGPKQSRLVRLIFRDQCP